MCSKYTNVPVLCTVHKICSCKQPKSKSTLPITNQENMMKHFIPLSLIKTIYSKHTSTQVWDLNDLLFLIKWH